jgi:Ser/Thr protein kinase RdoA (MazF antagonist)
MRGWAGVVSHATFDPDFIASEVGRRYVFAGPARVQLLYRGINDVYTVRDTAGSRALRVWRSGTRTDAQIAQELDFLDYLHGCGIGVSYAVPTAAGARMFVLDAPEGPRQAVLYTWAPGRKFGDQLDVGLAERIGARFAELHLQARSFPGTIPAEAPSASFRDNLPYLLDWVEDRASDVRDYTLLADRLGAEMERLTGRDLPRGMCHQDMHPSNVHVAIDGTITFIDFDGCAPGYWLHDVKNFVFGNDFYGFDDTYGAAFERGYRSVRPYTADEVALGELFLLNKAYRLLGGAARAAKSRGRDLLRFRSLDWFGHYIKSRAVKAGLL